MEQDMSQSMPMTTHELSSFSVEALDLPDLKNWEINSEHFLILKVKVVEKRNNEYLASQMETEKRSIAGTLKIVSIKSPGVKPITLSDLEQQDIEEMTAKVRERINK